MEEHYRRWKWMLGSFGAMVGCWMACWIIGWEAAVVACMANGFFLLGLYFAFTMYPPEKDSDGKE